MTLFRMFVNVIGDSSQNRIPPVSKEIDQFLEQHKFVFEVELNNSHLQDEINLVDKHRADELQVLNDIIDMTPPKKQVTITVGNE